ncbi:hypothetical protein CspHIS471_0500870 [Cutaneotrichosporon sp. HIS471]|nr:hypothetical protein CspHIS471_0500870 [Cutaneotrichosporon sp. HIS471]
MLLGSVVDQAKVTRQLALHVSNPNTLEALTKENRSSNNSFGPVNAPTTPARQLVSECPITQRTSPAAPETAPTNSPHFPQLTDAHTVVATSERHRPPSNPIPIPAKLRMTAPERLGSNPFCDSKEETGRSLLLSLFEILAQLPGGSFLRERESPPISRASSSEIAGKISLNSNTDALGRRCEMREVIPYGPFRGGYLVMLTPLLMTQVNSLHPGQNPELLNSFDVFTLFDCLRQIPPGTVTFHNLHDYIIWRVEEGRPTGGRSAHDTIGTAVVDHGVIPTQRPTTISAHITSTPAMAMTDYRSSSHDQKSPGDPHDDATGRAEGGLSFGKARTPGMASTTNLPTAYRRRRSTLVKGFAVGVPIYPAYLDDDTKVPKPADETPFEEDEENTLS